MQNYIIAPATLDTLHDLYALHPDPADAQKQLERLRLRLQAGQAALSDTLIMRSARGVEAALLMASSSRVPVFPRYRADTPVELVTAFLNRVREAVALTPQRQLVLDDSLVPLNRAAAEAAGWTFDEAHCLYRTPLKARPYRLDPEVRELQPDALDAHQRLLGALGQSDWGFSPGWRLYGLADQMGEIVALAACGSGQGPNGLLDGRIDLLGVHPERRRQGYGTRLHGHLLAILAQEFDWHSGGTGAGNRAMRRLFEKHGALLQATQAYFRQPGHAAEMQR